jgi:hypothetical protein
MSKPEHTRIRNGVYGGVPVTRRFSGVGNMKALKAAAASAAVILLSGAGGADAADLATVVKAPALTATPGPSSCTSIQDFFLTACQLAWHGVRFYGTIDVGYGYQTHGAPFDKTYGPAVDDLLGKMNRGGMGLLSPNGLSQSNIGIQIKEPLGRDGPSSRSWKQGSIRTH